MKTAVELDKAGNKVRVFHRTASGMKAWVHDYAARWFCPECTGKAGK